MKNNIVKGMMVQTEDFYDSLFWRSLSEGYFPILHDKYYEEEGEFYCGRFSVKFNSDIYTVTIEEGEACLFRNGEFTDDMPARYVTVKKGDVEIYNDFDIPYFWEEMSPKVGWHYDLSQLIEEWEGLLSYDRNKWRRPLLR